MWVKDLSVRPQTIKIPEENTGSNVFDIGYSNNFLDMFPEARETKAKINHWDYIKIKSFYTVKETINKRNLNLVLGSFLGKDIGKLSIKGLISKILTNLTPNKTTTTKQNQYKYCD